MNPSISKAKKIVFSVAALLIPVLVLALLEAGLRLAGYGDDLRLFIPLEKNPQYRITNPQVGRRYFVRQDFLPATSYDAFRAQKPAHTFRIFVLGGSTTAGFPYFNNGAFPRMPCRM